MNTRTQIALVLTLFTAALGTRAESILRGADFAPLQPVSGKSGKTVAIQAVLLGKYWDTETRKYEYKPLRAADESITFQAYRKVNSTGTRLIDMGPVGRPVPRQGTEGEAKTTYKLPSGAKKKLAGRYKATFAGGMYEGVNLRRAFASGDVIVNP